MPSPSPQFEPEPPRLDLCHTGGVSQVRFPRGRVDGVAVRELFEAAMALTDTPSPKLLIDLTGVSMLPSGAVGIVITIRKKFLQYGGQVHLAGAEPLVLESLEVMNLHRVLRIFATPDEAMAAFK